MNNNSQVEILTLQKEKLLESITILETQKETAYKDYIRIRKEVEVAKQRIEIEPALKEFLEKFQRKEQEKLVGVNQNLLTAILQDVMKNDNEERKVVMDIFTERSLPALSIFIEKNQQGVLEDVYNGAGGAVANILSLGLRAIALVQSKKRRFLVLDEPDCWIKPELIPNFVQVIKQLSEKLKIQILIISHHDESLLDGINHRLILEKVNGKINTRWSNQLGCSQPVWEDSDDGIRSVYLENFQSHSSTIVPLAKTVTLLTGLNDLGKSTIVNALRAVFYGLGDDTNIKHHENEAKVSIDFGKFGLFWERRVKGKPKESFTLIDEVNDFSNPLHRTESAREVPEWLEQETGIGLIEGFDIQLGHQKKPVFLLDEPASKKAKALSIGDESNYVQQMIALSKEDLTTSRQIVKKGEEELERNYKILRIFEKYADKTKSLKEEIKSKIESSIELVKKNEELKKQYEAINKIKKEKEIIDNLLFQLQEMDLFMDELKERREEKLKHNLSTKQLMEQKHFVKAIEALIETKKEKELFDKLNFEELKLNSEKEPKLSVLEIKKLLDNSKVIQKYIKDKKLSMVFEQHYPTEKVKFDSDLNNKLKATQNTIQRLSLLKDLEDLIKELKIQNKIKELKDNLEKTQIENVLKLNKTEEVKRNITRLDSILKVTEDLNSGNQSKVLLVEQEREVKQKLSEFKQCPLCLQSITHKHY